LQVFTVKKVEALVIAIILFYRFTQLSEITIATALKIKEFVVIPELNTI